MTGNEGHGTPSSFEHTVEATESLQAPLRGTTTATRQGSGQDFPAGEYVSIFPRGKAGFVCKCLSLTSAFEHCTEYRSESVLRFITAHMEGARAPVWTIGGEVTVHDFAGLPRHTALPVPSLEELVRHCAHTGLS